MATQVPPLRGATYYFETSLVSQADANIFQTNPTLAAGDVVVYQDGALDGNIDALPTVIGAGKLLAVTLSIAEMTADRVVVMFSDQAGAEWQDQEWSIHTVTTSQVDDLATAAALATVDGNVDAILLDTGTDGVVLANDAIKATKYDESTAYPLKAADTGSTYVARTGADNDTLETLSDEIAGVTAPTAAAVADAVWEETLADHSGTAGSTAEALAGATAPSAAVVADAVWDELETGHVSTGKAGEQLWTQIDAIKAKTDLISQSTLSIAATVKGSTISVYNYTTWVVTYSNAAIDLSGRDSDGAIVTVKCNLSDADSAAICQVQEGVGLLYMNGAAAVDASKATLVINGDEDGFTLTVDESVTGVSGNNDLNWDLKQIETGAVTEEVQGAWKILGAVTRAVTA